MTVLFIVLPLAILIVIGALIAFTWAARSGQFDDLDTPAVRMLHDDVPGDRDGTESRPQVDPNAAETPGTSESTRRAAEGHGGPRSEESG